MTDALTEEEEAVLQLADRDLQGGPLLNALRTLSLTETTFSAALNRLIDTQKAEAAYPMLVHRLRRLRASRVAVRRRW